MAKILLVEDDNNLREIYEARLQAEGYTIVSARDGEEALVVAKAETPDLVISDVMMPKISGFEMLDILRDTETLRDVKVIMLTALGQAEDQTRADKLGADRYLVKSQVTLEDIVNVTGELLGAAPATPDVPATAPTAVATVVAAAPEPVVTAPAAAPTVAPVAAAAPTPAPAPAPEPVVVTAPAPEPEPIVPPAVDTQPTQVAEAATIQSQIDSFAAAPAATPATLDPDQIAKDQAMQDALTTLDEAQDDQPADAAATEAAVPTAEPTSAPEPTDTTEEATTAPEEAQSEYVAGVSGKKIIAPIDHNTQDKKSLDQLLAEEEAKESGLGIPVANSGEPAPDTPPTTAMPAADPAILANTNANPSSEDDTIDPSSVAL